MCRSVSVYLCVSVSVCVCVLRLVTLYRFCFRLPLCVVSSDLFVLLSFFMALAMLCFMQWHLHLLLLISENADAAKRRKLSDGV